MATLRVGSGKTAPGEGWQPYGQEAVYIDSTGSDAYVANTVTRPFLPAHADRSRASVVQRTPAASSSASARSEQTATIGPTRPASRQAATVWTRRSSVGTRTSTRPVRATRKAVCAPITVLPVPHAETIVARSPTPPEGTFPRARTAASTAST